MRVLILLYARIDCAHLHLLLMLLINKMVCVCVRYVRVYDAVCPIRLTYMRHSVFVSSVLVSVRLLGILGTRCVYAPTTSSKSHGPTSSSRGSSR
jgi:hypothetical protein